MNKILMLLCAIELLIIGYFLLSRRSDYKFNTHNKFNIDDYEYLILTIWRNILKETNIETINMDNVCEEIRDTFYIELEKENITISNKIDDVNVKGYINNLIFTNKLLEEFDNYSEDEEEPDINTTIDEVITRNNEATNSVSMLDAINKFYK